MISRAPFILYMGSRGPQNDLTCQSLSVGAVEIQKTKLQSASAGSCGVSHDYSTLEGETELKVDSDRGPHRQVHLTFPDSPCGVDDWVTKSRSYLGTSTAGCCRSHGLSHSDPLGRATAEWTSRAGSRFFGGGRLDRTRTLVGSEKQKKPQRAYCRPVLLILY